MTEHLESMRAVYGRPYPEMGVSNREMRWALMDIAAALGQPGDTMTPMSDPSILADVLVRLGMRDDFTVGPHFLKYSPEFEWNDE